MFNLTLGADVLGNWTVYSLSIDEAVHKGLLSASSGFISTSSSFNTSPAPALSPPAFYAGSFIIPDDIPDLPQDTYIQFPNWRKVGVLTDSVVILKSIYKCEEIRFTIDQRWCNKEITSHVLFQGQVWINGFNVGRYWPSRGPQITLFVPAHLLSTSAQNNITVLELEASPCSSGACTVEFTDTPVLNGTVKSTGHYKRSSTHKTFWSRTNFE